MQLNAIENAKIDCCSRLFKEMSTARVRYHKVACYQDLLDAMSYHIKAELHEDESITISKHSVK